MTSRQTSATTSEVRLRLDSASMVAAVNSVLPSSSDLGRGENGIKTVICENANRSPVSSVGRAWDS